MNRRGGEGRRKERLKGRKGKNRIQKDVLTNK